jgi:hypothetical protein
LSNDGAKSCELASKQRLSTQPLSRQPLLTCQPNTHQPNEIVDVELRGTAPDITCDTTGHRRSYSGIQHVPQLEGRSDISHRFLTYLPLEVWADAFKDVRKGTRRTTRTARKKRVDEVEGVAFSSSKAFRISAKLVYQATNEVFFFGTLKNIPATPR